MVLASQPAISPNDQKHHETEQSHGSPASPAFSAPPVGVIDNDPA
jgi:hypothetical protein